jgi:hypothetical protein
MTEITIRSNNNIAIQKLIDFLQLFDFQIIKKREIITDDDDDEELPITYAEEPDVLALAGIWEGRNITQEELRQKAWGDRR